MDEIRRPTKKTVHSRETLVKTGETYIGKSNKLARKSAAS